MDKSKAEGYENVEDYLTNHPEIKKDYFISLSEEGIQHAFQRKEDFNLKGFDVKMFYSGRPRAGQTASAIASEKTPEGYPYSRIDVLEKGKDGMGIDSRLDFEEGNTKSDYEAVEAYKKGELTKWIIEDSNSFSKEKGEYREFGLSYDKLAANIASLLLEQINPKDDKQKEALVMGSHQGLFESFLAKVIEKTEGLEKRSEFIEVIGKQGFDFAEGFEIDVMSDNSLIIKFSKEGNNEKPDFIFEEKINAQLLEEIVKDYEV